MAGPRRKKLSGARQQAIEALRNRLMVAILLFAGTFAVLALRTVELGLGAGEVRNHAHIAALKPRLPARADIVDRNGVLLATNLETASLYADPKKVTDVEETASRLSRLLPDLSRAELAQKLQSNRRFVWLKRRLTPEQTWRVNALGIPGLAFQMEEERVYPMGPLAAHALGYVNVDGEGLAGLELYFDGRLANASKNAEPLSTSIDVRVQHALADEVGKAMTRFDAKAAAGLVMDVNSGEILGLVSMPDFDPNHAGDYPAGARFNRVTQGVYELGSVFKTFTVAMALETGTVTLQSGYDATHPIRIARYVIRDDHPKARYLTVPEIFAYSSNIGAAKMAVDVGPDKQREFLQNLGFLDSPGLEISELGRPIYPARWREINTMTIAYGHGLAVTPLQLASGVAAMVNGGVLIPATLVAKSEPSAVAGRKVISSATSQKLRALLRTAVLNGTGSQADVPGYRVGGKTGTAEKAVAGGYAARRTLSSFVGVFPMDAPRFLVFVMLDEPVGTAETLNFAGGGWVAAPPVRNVITRIAPVLGVEPSDGDDSRFRRVALMVADDD